MAAPYESSNVDSTAQDFELFCIVEATVVTGFEEIAKGEVEEKCGIVTKVSRGKINLKLPVEKAKQVLVYNEPVYGIILFGIFYPVILSEQSKKSHYHG